eukprot:Protomagalhaensia_sp_Gyna_25__5532@NODE_747_length_2706_cov_389_136858_g585_i0_p3_GENE_NODE_747_length_2706_cov_389_136858_g585_i0NODE_747_length_2706_cov_389_136858_g585_i0_p3_ORF_typecomplete_len195_score26_67zfMIZ/PF02891_20/6_6e18zfNse/PF11789_8/0_017DUF4577/PF15145_6/0_17_NODE_747_length_2706_cov_389_136858_g585_i04301014
MSATFENAYDGPYLVTVLKVHSEVGIDMIVKRIVENNSVSKEDCAQFAMEFLQPETPNGVSATVVDDPDDDDDEELVVIDSLNPLNAVKLTCPSTMMRIGIPARGIHCKHVQCFDLHFFVHSQRSAIHQARWKCPVCRLYCRPHELIVDAWMRDILMRTSENDKQIILIVENGKLQWTLPTQEPRQHNTTPELI